MEELMKKAFAPPQRPVVLVTRAEWGALPSREMEALPHPIDTVAFAYNTHEPICRTKETCIQALQRLQKTHMEDLGLSDIYYNFIVGGDGVVYEGRGWNSRHPKTVKFRKRRGNILVIGIIGDGKAFNGKYFPHESTVDGFDEWRPPYEVVAPGMDLIRKGITDNYVIEYHNVFEDLDDIEACEMPGC